MKSYITKGLFKTVTQNRQVLDILLNKSDPSVVFLKNYMKIYQHIKTLSKTF